VERLLLKMKGDEDNMKDKAKPMLMQLQYPEFMCPKCGSKFYLSLDEEGYVLYPLATHCKCCNIAFDWDSQNGL